MRPAGTPTMNDTHISVMAVITSNGMHTRRRVIFGAGENIYFSLTLGLRMVRMLGVHNMALIVDDTDLRVIIAGVPAGLIWLP